MDAHEREAAAATAAMDRRPVAVGDRVKGYAGGRRFTGTLVAVDASWVTCRRCDIERDTDG